MKTLDLKKLFGPDSRGDTVEVRAKTSSNKYVRSQDQIAEYIEGATGHVLTAWECLQNFGIEVLIEIYEEGTAVLVSDISEPARSIKERRESLNLTIDEVARFSKLSKKEIADIEDQSTRSPIFKIEKVAQILSLDERKISFKPGSGGDASLGARLKKSKTGDARGFSAGLVVSLHEASWVIATQERLRRWLEPSANKPKWEDFSPSENYGSHRYPAWQHGYWLALETRNRLGIKKNEPIKSLRDLCTSALDVPIVQNSMPRSIAGATIESNGIRGISINVLGDNENVWVRRSTIAHELGHLLWDPSQNLNSIVVDKYDDFRRTSWRGRDGVEQRANAFAAEFLAPQNGIVEIFRSHNSPSDGLRAIMENYGISFTTARFHLANAIDNPSLVSKLSVEDVWPTDDWNGRESFTVDFFPLENTPISRRDVFSRLVLDAYNENLISENTACQYLKCSTKEFIENKEAILSIFQ